MSAIQITDDVCYQTMLHSRDIRQNPNDKAKKIAQILDSSLQRRDLTMGAGYQRDTTSQVLALSNHPHFVSHAERHALSSAVDAELSADMQMQLDLMQAAGSMTKDLKDSIIEISAKADTYTPAQKVKFVAVVFNTYQLQQVNAGRIALPTAQIEKLASDALNIMTELATDAILPPSLKTMSLDVVKSTAKVFRLPALDKAIAKFEKDTSPAEILKQSVEALTVTLLALLEQEDLDKETRLDIEDALEQLNAIEDGDPIPREILKSLDGIAAQIAEKSGHPILVAIAATLNQNIEVVREANIPVKAEKFNLSADQVRAIEATMDRLEALGEELPKDEITLKGMIAEAILALDKDPVSIKAMAKLEAVTDTLQEPKFKALERISPVILTIAASIIESTRFVQKFLTEGVAKQFDIPKGTVKQFTSVYNIIQNSITKIPEAKTEIIATAKQALKAITTNPVSIATAGLISNVTKTLSLRNISPKIQTALESVQKTQIKLLEKIHGVAPTVIKKSITMVSSLISLRDAVIPTRADIKQNLIVQPINKLIETISKSPVSMETLVKVTELMHSKGIEQLSKGNKNIAQLVQGAKKSLDGMKDAVTSVFSEKLKQPFESVKKNVDATLKATKEAAIAEGQKVFSLSKAFAAATSTTIVDLSRYGMSFAKKISESISICGVTCRGAKGCCPSFKKVAEYKDAIKARLKQTLNISEDKNDTKREATVNRTTRARRRNNI